MSISQTRLPNLGQRLGIVMLVGCQPQADAVKPTQLEKSTILPTNTPSKETPKETNKPTAAPLLSVTPIPEEPVETELSSEMVKLCGETLPPPAPVGSKPAADLQLAETGFHAEWFVPLSQFNMPLEVLITPDGEILVQSVRVASKESVTMR